VKPVKISITLAAHALLLVLASTQFTILSWTWGEWGVTWNYFQYASRSGFGSPYQSAYSATVVLTYLLAHVAGITGYLAGRRMISTWLLGTGLSLCVLGLVSFTLEGSHWFWSHHHSWIVSCPAASLLIAVIATISIWRKDREQALTATRTVLSQG
jgi:hypothetical protein